MTRRTSDREKDREAHIIDAHVGKHVRQRRLLVGASQEQLGNHLGLTFQQIQKYENGANRISAGRLLKIANFLGVRVESFFEGLAVHDHLLDNPSQGDRERIIEFALTREGERWIEGYLNAPPRQRRLAMDILQLQATPESAGGSSGR